MEVRVSDVCKNPEGISGKEAVVIQVAPTGTVLISITVRKSGIILTKFKNSLPYSRLRFHRFSPKLKVIYRRAHPFNPPRILLTYPKKFAKDLCNSVMVKVSDLIISHEIKSNI